MSDSNLLVLESEYQGLKAEIERLKGLVIERDNWLRPNEPVVPLGDYSKALAEIERLKQLIAELAAELARFLGPMGMTSREYGQQLQALVQRAREASNDE